MKDIRYTANSSFCENPKEHWARSHFVPSVMKKNYLNEQCEKKTSSRIQRLLESFRNKIAEQTIQGAPRNLLPLSRCLRAKPTESKNYSLKNPIKTNNTRKKHLKKLKYKSRVFAKNSKNRPSAKPSWHDQLIAHY